MLKFTITSELKNYKGMTTFKANKFNEANNIEKIICTSEKFNLEVGNSYKCIVDKEDKDNILIKEIEQIDIDINIMDECKSKLKEMIDIDDIKMYLQLKDMEEINKQIDDNNIKKQIVQAYNKNNLVKLLNNNSILLTGEYSYKIDTVVSKYKNKDVAKTFEDKPYLLIYYFATNDNLNLKNIKSINNSNINLCKIILTVRNEEQKGHAFIQLSNLNEKIKNDKKLNNSLKVLEKEDIIKIKDDKVYLKDTYDAEKVLIDNLIKRSMISSNILNDSEMKIIDEVINKAEIVSNETKDKLNEEQKKSIIESVKNNITIINGKAGSGKSTVINSIIKAIKAVNIKASIEVISLSGKAVNVINSKIYDDKDNNYIIHPQTIHRLFGFIGNNYNRVKKIKALDYLILDEMSMIDLVLLSKILELVPLKTKIIFCGDLNQIPPIGIGTPMQDILKSKRFKDIELLVNNRQRNKFIAKNSIKILKKDSNLDYKNNEFELINKEDKYFKELKKRIEALIEKGYSLNDIMIVTNSNFVTNGINNVVKDIVSQEYRYKDNLTIEDKVMQIKNNYDKKVFNGEIGQIVSVTNGFNTKVEVMFKNKLVEYSSYEIKELNLAYAMTVCKSQGSESKVVIIYISKEDEKYLNRNILYTAITRAEEICIIIGPEKVFNEAICKIPEEKNSSVFEELTKIA